MDKRIDVTELGIEVLETVIGASWENHYAERWAAAHHKPVDWKAIGEQLSATYIASHSTHLGRPLK